MLLVFTVFPFAPELPVFPEPLGKRVVVDLELGDFLVLIRGDPQEGGFGEDEGVEDAELKGDQIVGLDHVDTGYVFVHGGQDDLKK